MHDPAYLRSSNRFGESNDGLVRGWTPEKKVIPCCSYSSNRNPRALDLNIEVHHGPSPVRPAHCEEVNVANGRDSNVGGEADVVLGNGEGLL